MGFSPLLVECFLCEVIGVLTLVSSNLKRFRWRLTGLTLRARMLSSLIILDCDFCHVGIHRKTVMTVQPLTTKLAIVEGPLCPAARVFFLFHPFIQLLLR
ncbi:hypothetical protein AB6A40_011392 [Gnathostoma spinigerum]|uniref:Secreted protein n=1 Tax=Gnathostoma spinigerum TaxID=75299 RepID=A0ABD6EXI5_9BILA